MIPSLVLSLVPIPSATLLLLLTVYHLTPLLALFQSSTPLLEKLSGIIPHPRRSNLPREFFNLPPRPGSPSSYRVTASGLLGIRGKVVLLLSAQALLSIGCGWAWINSAGDHVAVLALSLTPLSSGVFTLCLFSALHHQRRQWDAERSSKVRKELVGNAGITHSAFPAITAYSSLLTLLITIVAGVAPHGHKILLGATSFLVIWTITLSLLAHRGHPDGRRLRLASPSPPPLEKRYVPTPTHDELEAMRDGDSWLESPPQARSIVSAFSYSPGSDHGSNSPRDTEDSPNDSWLTEPTRTQSSIPSWKYSPSIHSPEPARTRSRSPSPCPETNLPQPASGPATNAPKGSTSTIADRSINASTFALTSTPGSAIRSAGGSIIGAYSPDPFQPVPRGFESLASFPLSPEQMASQISLAARTAHSGITFVLSERITSSASRVNSSTWTLETYHSAQEDFRTPAKQIRRAAPPPPMPVGMPLPPTPTAARSETVFDLSEGQGQKGSMEMLMGDKDWVEVGRGVEGIKSWGKGGTGGTGVGTVGVLGMVVCYALTTPLLVIGITDTTMALYLVALALPAPVLALVSYLLRYRPPPTTRAKNQSIKSVSTHRSLALQTPSELSLPISISPKLTPPAPKRASTAALGERMSKLVEPKPSISNFGYTYTRQRPHTIYGLSPTIRDLDAEETMRRTLARRSGDVWIESGHAVESGGLWSRATEMLKPVPALRVLGDLPRGEGMLTRLRGGVVSMLPKRRSAVDEEFAMGQFDDAPRRIQEEEVHAGPSPIRINIESPSKYDRRVSATSAFEDAVGEGDGEGEVEVEAEVQYATKGRMSASPTFYYAPGHGQLDWFTRGVLPGLVPSLRSRIGDTPRSKAAGDTVRRASLDATPRSHARTSSIDFTLADSSTPAGSMRNRRHPLLRHKSSFSLPTIDTAEDDDFDGIRRSFDESGRDEAGYETGMDLPPFPVDFSRPRPRELSPVSEKDENTTSSSLGEMAALDRRAEANLKSAYSPASIATASRTRLESNASADVGMTSIISEDEALAQEMELVLAMDTPTRAEFVISPPPSEFTPTSRWASTRSSSRQSYADSTTPLRPQVSSNTLRSKDSSGSIASEYTFTYSITDATTDGEGGTDSPAPPVPELPGNFRYPTAYQPPVISHPHPPPSAASFDAHRPVKPHPSLHSLVPRKSIETISSQSSGEALSPIRPEWKPSRKELELVKVLKERAGQTRKEDAKAKADKQEEAVKRQSQSQGLRPLQLVSDKQANRLSSGPAGGRTAKDKLPVLEDSNGASGLNGGSTKLSLGSDKENVRRAKVSKLSTASGTSVGGIRV